LDIVRARALRRKILFNKRDVRRERVHRDGIAHPCWRVQGEGWHALVLTMWDAVNAASPAEPDPSVRDDLLQREMLELFVDGDDQPVLAINYQLGSVSLDELRPGSHDETVTVFRRGDWERLFDRDRGHFKGRRCDAVPEGPLPNPFDFVPRVRRRRQARPSA